jgi:ACS family allantoate permease-like MFS transporter
VVAYGIAIGTQKHGSSIAPWKIVFLFTGVLTILLGLVFYWIVPDNQLNARWLKKEDRVLAVARVRINQQGIGNKHFKMYQVKEALLDPMTWAFFFYALIADIPNGGITNFFSQLVRSPPGIFGLLTHPAHYQSLLFRLPVSVSPKRRV